MEEKVKLCLDIYPGEPHTPDSPGEHVRQDAGEGVPGWEVGVEPRVLPVGHPDHDLVLHVLHDVLPGLWVVGRRGGNEIAEISRLYRGSHSSRVDLLNNK